MGSQDGADGLVRRVVPSDVLTRESERPVRLEESGRVKASGRGEN